jgi:hypothetical protein
MLRFPWMMGPLRDPEPEPGGGDGKTPETPAKGKKEDDKPPTAAELKAARDESAALKKAKEDAEEATRYWFEKAQAKDEKPPKGKKAKAQEDDEDEDDVDIVEVLNTKGKKGLDEYLEKSLKKRGYLSKEEAEALIERRATQIVTDAELAKDYPDLKDHKSDFFKETARQYKQLGDDVKEEKRTVLAAKLAEAELRRTGKWKDPEAETERRKRIDAQDGRPGYAGESGEPEDDEMTTRQKFFSDQLGVSHENYKKRAKAGVQFTKPHDLGTRLAKAAN